MDKPLHINIEAVLASKSKKLARFVPSFLIRYLERIVHQDEMNEAFTRYKDVKGVDFIHTVFDYLDIKYTSSGLDSLPRDGRYLFASNHPFGGMDGMMLVDEMTAHLGPSKIIANDLLMNIVNLQSVFVPVNKHGGQSREVLAQFREVMNSDICVATFPSGLCSRMIDSQVADLEWKTTFIKDAIKSKRDIVPVYFDGRLSNFFYRLYKIRKFLGIKFNIEMLYLVDELFKQRGGRFEIRFGAPIPLGEFENTKDLRAVAALVRERVYQMRK